MANKYRCTNCGWEGRWDDMDVDDTDQHSCPLCCAPFNTDGDHPGPWEIEVEDDDEDEDYGYFDD